MEPGASIADDPAASTTKIATVYIIWIVRIALPIIFFWVWYRTQPEKASWYSLPHEISRSRDELMQVRRSVASSAVPKAMSNLRVVHEAALPQSSDGARTSKRGGAKRDVHPKRVEEPSPAVVQPTSGQRVEEPSPAEVQPTSEPASVEQGNAGPGEGERKGGPEGGVPLADKERMHFEKMLNYVAFSHKDRAERVFLPEEGRPPPPPRRLEGQPEADAPEAARANADARDTLQCVAGAPGLELRPSDVSGALYRRLTESRVRVSEATLAMMAESCANAGDLKGASEFLMKMEAAGHCPDSALLDKVMDLFSEEKDAQAGVVAPIAGEPGESDARGAGPATHPWSAAKEAAPHPHALNFSAYSEDECE